MSEETKEQELKWRLEWDGSIKAYEVKQGEFCNSRWHSKCRAKLRLDELNTRAPDQSAEVEKLYENAKIMSANSDTISVGVDMLTKERDAARAEVERLVEFIKDADRSRIECDQAWVDKTLNLKRKLAVAITMLESVARGNHNAKYEAKQTLKQIKESEVQGE